MNHERLELQIEEWIESNCECGLQENGQWSEELFEERGCSCRNDLPSHLTGENRMTGPTYIVSHCRGSEDSWEVFDDEATAKASYRNLLALAEDQDDRDLISLSAVMDSSDYNTHPAFEYKSAATSFSDALDAYIKETVTKTVNEQLAVSEDDIGEKIETYLKRRNSVFDEYMTKEDVEERIEDLDFVDKDSLESMLEDSIDQYRFVDRDDVDVMLEDMLEDFMHKEAIEQSIEESVKELVPDVIKHLINDGQIALTTKTASDPINLQ